MKSLRPPEIVQLLDEHIVGQQRAKRALAVAIRNRWRDQQIDTGFRDDRIPYRYILTGPRGAGKTTLVRRAALVLEAPFASVSVSQLASAGSADRAIELACEALVQSARCISETTDLDAAILDVESSGILLIDGFDRWLHGTDDTLDEPLQIAQLALYGLAAAPRLDVAFGQVHARNIMVFVTGDLTAARHADVPDDLQHLFPRRLELDALTHADLLDILVNPNMSPLNDFAALLHADGLQIVFSRDGIEAIAGAASDLNTRIEDIGARRLIEVVEFVLDDLLYDGTSAAASSVTIDEAYVASRLSAERDDEDLDDFIL